jgi:transposase
VNSAQEQKLLPNMPESTDLSLAGETEESAEGAPSVAAKPRVKTINRAQLLMRTVDVERLIAEDHPARAIWEFTGRLDLSPFYEAIGAVSGVAGRSAWDPRLLISLWILAYSQGVGSAREVARRVGYDPAYQWLTGMQAINYHTLSDLRVGHKEALDGLFTQALGVMSAEGLIALEQVMHDGTKVKACAGVDTFRREETLREHLRLAREQVEQLGDPESEEISRRVARARARAAEEKKARLEAAVAEYEKLSAGKNEKERKKLRVSETDPQARNMKQGDGGFAPSYNMQVSADTTAGVVVGVEVTQAGSDYEQLIPAVEVVEGNMGRPPQQVVADGGYTSRGNIVAMAEKGVDFVGSMDDGAAQSAGQLSRRGIDPAYGPAAFVHNPETNTYTCPEGQTLSLAQRQELPGAVAYRYQAQVSACAACPFKMQCCPQAEWRTFSVVQEAAPVVAFRAKMDTEQAKAIYRQRGRWAEFPNAWIKEKIGLRQFRTRGLAKVRMEALWVCLTYNIQQWIRLCWRTKLAQVA